jgi:hypothetical protein
VRGGGCRRVYARGVEVLVYGVCSSRVGRDSGVTGWRVGGDEGMCGVWGMGVGFVGGGGQGGT